MTLFLLTLACPADGPGDGHAASDTAPHPQDSPPGETGTSAETGDAAETGATEEPATVALAFSSTDAAIDNPERGLYTWAYLEHTDVSTLRAEGYTLVYTPLVLADHRDSAIPQSTIDTWSAGFDRLREAGLKAIVRATYTDYDTGEYDDASADRILEHIAQLEPLLATHADVIATQQAGWMGAWGEWHSSTNGLFDDEATWTGVLDAIVAALPEHRTVQLRTPMFKQTAYGGPLDATDAFSGTPAARVGHHNDCFLASDTDWGTYPEHAIETYKDFVAQEGLYLPVGGETCNDDPARTTCPVATEELERLHWSYLNILWHPDVIERWRNEGCFDEVVQRLGYRFALTDGEVSEAVAPGGLLQLALTLENHGYASPFNPRDVVLVLRSESERHEASLPDDPRTWTAGDAQDLRWTLRLPASLPTGTYDLALWLPDPEPSLRDDERYAIQLANEGLWQAGENVIGSVVVRDDAGGATDPSATVFEAI